MTASEDYFRGFQPSSILLPTAYVVRREGYVLTHVCPSVCPHLGGYPGQVQTEGVGGTPARFDWGGYPSQVQVGGDPGQVQVGGWGVPTSGNRWSPWYAGSVCLLRSRRRTFLYINSFELVPDNGLPYAKEIFNTQPNCPLTNFKPFFLEAQQFWNVW